MQQNNTKISNGVMLNVYPDSIGEKFSDTITMLKMTEFKEVFINLNSCQSKTCNNQNSR